MGSGRCERSMGERVESIQGRRDSYVA